MDTLKELKLVFSKVLIHVECLDYSGHFQHMHKPLELSRLSSFCAALAKKPVQFKILEEIEPLLQMMFIQTLILCSYMWRVSE